MFGGESQFPDKSVIRGNTPVFSRRLPARPPHLELTDRVWEMIKGCWKVDLAKRRTIDEVITVLEAEANGEKGNGSLRTRLRPWNRI